MTNTDTPTAANNINAALADLQTQLPHISKDNTANVPTKTGGSYRYTYADLAQISREVLPVMGKLGLSFTSRPTLRDGKLVLVYELRHISGDVIAGEYPLPDRGTPQEVGGAITYARRYCLCAVTGVAPDDDDSDAVLAERAAQRQQRRSDRGGQPAATDDAPRITAEQQRDMQSGFQALGITDKAKKLEFATAVVKRQLRSATELKQAEAAKVVEAINHAVARRAAQQAESADTPAARDAAEAAWLETQQPPEGQA